MFMSNPESDPTKGRPVKTVGRERFYEGGEAPTQEASKTPQWEEDFMRKYGGKRLPEEDEKKPKKYYDQAA